MEPLVSRLVITGVFLLLLTQGIVSQDSNTVQPEDATASEETEETTEAFVPAMMKSTGQTIGVQSGSPVWLPCDIENLDKSGGVVTWFKGDKPLTNGRQKINRSPSMVLEANYTLTLKKARDSDAGEYMCKVLQFNGLAEVRHIVTITVPPSVDLEPQEAHVEVSKGGIFDISCRSKGLPTPRIRWYFTKAGSPEEKTELTEHFNKSDIHIENLSRVDGGQYTCEADNDVGTPASSSITVILRYQPEVLDYTGLFLTKIGGDAKLECSFSAFPTGQVQFSWHRVESGQEPAEDGSSAEKQEEIHPDDRITIDTVVKDTTTITSTLLIKNVQADDFRKYKCTAQNELGSDSHHVELSALPHAIKVQPSEKREPLKYGLTWSVKSSTPVKEYRIIYREVNETHEGVAQNLTIPEDEKAFQTDSRQNMIYEETYFLKDLRPSTNYTLKMAALNEYGWSRESDLHKFFIDSQSGLASSLHGRGGVSLGSLYRPLAPISAVLVLWISRRVFE